MEFLSGDGAVTETVEQLKVQLGRLSNQEKAELAHFLLVSLEPEEEGVAEAWTAEIARRTAEIRSGSAAGKPAEQLFAELREKYP
jgi:putative addiction module component (TIGR02574 family)